MLLPGETVPVAALSAIGMALLAVAVAVVWVRHLRDERRFLDAVGRSMAAHRFAKADKVQAAAARRTSRVAAWSLGAGATGAATALVVLFVMDLAVRLAFHTDLGTILVAPLERFLDVRL